MFIIYLILLMQLSGGKAIPPQQVTWRLVAPSPSFAQGYQYKLYIQEESGVKSVITLLNTLCGLNNGLIECSTALPSTANVAIISNNYSRLTATDLKSNIESELSAPYIGDQGCIFRNNLFPVSGRTSIESNKGQINSILAEFKAAKFKHISTTPGSGGRLLITEECVGFIVP